jgi:nucleotide-binding universal stress UspA family protein
VKEEDDMQSELVVAEEQEKITAGTLPSTREHLALKNILLPTDFSADSVKALNYAAALAQQFDGVLWLLHVAEPAPTFSGYEGIPVASIETEQLTRAEAQMAEFAAKYLPQSISVTSLVRYGSAVKEISALASAREIDLLVISTHGRTGVSHAIYGSLAERILHHAPCPILVVRNEEHDFLQDGADPESAKIIRLRRILAPVDFSVCSRKALHYAEAFANQFGAEIHCAHILEPEKPMIVFETESFRKTQEIDASRKFAEAVNAIDASVQVESAIKSGHPDREIVELATERDIDLIILGEHSRSGLKRFLVGSTIDEVLKRAHCPVLIVRETEHEFA